MLRPEVLTGGVVVERSTGRLLEAAKALALGVRPNAAGVRVWKSLPVVRGEAKAEYRILYVESSTCATVIMMKIENGDVSVVSYCFNHQRFTRYDAGLGVWRTVELDEASRWVDRFFKELLDNYLIGPWA